MIAREIWYHIPTVDLDLHSTTQEISSSPKDCQIMVMVSLYMAQIEVWSLEHMALRMETVSEVYIMMRLSGLESLAKI